MSWAERNRDLADRIRAYVLAFQDRKPAVFEHFQGGSDPVFPMEAGSDRGVGLLLYYCSLYQGIGEERLLRVLSYLWREYGPDIFRLNHLPFADLQARIQSLDDLDDWEIWPQVPGILRSVADFFYRHGKLMPWVYEVGNGEHCIEIISQEIFLMGKTSVFRSKSRYFLWMLTRLEGVDPGRFWTADTRMTLTLGHGRFVREFGPLKGRKRVPWTTPAEKLVWFNAFYRVLFPDRPWLVFLAFDAFMRPQSGYFRTPGGPPPVWQCRAVVGGCVNCPLAPECPGRDF